MNATVIPFDFLIGTYVSMGDMEGEVKGFNMESKKFILELEDDNGKWHTKEASFSELKIHKYASYKNEYLEKLKRKGYLSFAFLSTKYGDNWNFYIERTEFSLKTAKTYSDLSKMKVVVYTLHFADQIYETLTTDTTKEDSDFVKWFSDITETYTIFSPDL